MGRLRGAQRGSNVLVVRAMSCAAICDDHDVFISGTVLERIQPRDFHTHHDLFQMSQSEMSKNAQIGDLSSILSGGGRRADDHDLPDAKAGRQKRPEIRGNSFFPHSVLIFWGSARAHVDQDI